MEHINERHEKHITREDILEVMNHEPQHLKVIPSSKRVVSDYTVIGSTLDGKCLLLCVILNEELIKQLYKEWELWKQVSHPAEHYKSMVYAGRWYPNE